MKLLKFLGLIIFAEDYGALWRRELLADATDSLCCLSC